LILSARLSTSRLATLTFIGAASFVLLWSGVAVYGVTQRAFLPTPWEVVARFANLVVEPFAGFTLLEHLLSSFQRFAMGFVIAVMVGIPSGLLMAWFPWVDRIASPVFDAVRFVAPIAWVPFAALWFGTGIGGPVLIIFMGAFPPVLINTYRGAKNVDRTYIEAARMLGASNLRTMTHVLLPAAIPSIVAGLRISAGLGWQSLVGAELIVASSGVGYLMVKGQASISTSTVMSGMAAIGIVGVLIDISLRRVQFMIERRRGMQ
jgi:ABC-type nitrate/sulfonate/bicarbonate transport system permease component